LGDHAASLQYGTEGIMHGFNSIMLKDENGDPAPVYSVASGLDYPSSGPEHAFLHELGRVKYDVIGDDDTIDAFFELSRMEGIIPAIESAHAVAYGIKLAKKMGTGSVLINLSGRGDKDMDYVIEKYGIQKENALIAGDNHTDINAAAAAGIKSIFCEYGFGVLDNAVPTYSVKTFAELVNTACR
jgi:tryptophan synthase beta chain